MKAYKSSDLTHKRAEVLQEATKEGVIIQQLETNGKVRREFVIVPKDIFVEYCAVAEIESEIIAPFYIE